MSSWLLAMKLLSRTPRLNQLLRQRNTLMNIFSSLPVFSTQEVCNTQTHDMENQNRLLKGRSWSGPRCCLAPGTS